MTPKQKKQGEAKAIEKLSNTANELKNEFPELLNKYPFFIKDGIYMFKIISEERSISVHFSEICDFYGIEMHTTRPTIYPKSEYITEKEFNKLRNKVLKKLKLS